MRRTLLTLLGIVAALGAAEALLQLTLSRTLVQDRWFDGRIHLPDDELGYRYTPGYQGAMRHADGVFFEPLVLDSLGSRRSPSGAPGAADVVFLGGASLVFTYGLPESLTIPALTVGASRRDIRVHNTAWPGFGWNRNWLVYQRLVAPHIRPEVVVISLPYTPEKAARLEAADPRRAGSAFRYDAEMVVPPGGPVLRRMGRWGRRSLLLYRLGRAGDALARDLRARPPRPGQRVARREARAPIGRRIIEDDLAWMTDSLRAQGAAVVFVALPNRKASSPSAFDGLSIPEGVVALDLHRTLRDSMDGHWIANGHYDETASRWIAEAIAPAVDRALAGRLRADEPGRDVEPPPEHD